MGHEAPGIPTSPSSTLVRVVTGHVVSSSSMVSRAFLADAWRGIIVADAVGDHWLVCTLDALAPEQEGLLIRGEAESGLPRAYAKAALTKVVVAWIGGGGPSGEPVEITIANPRVVPHPGGASIGAVSLSRIREVAQHLEAGAGPSVHALTDADVAPDRYDIETLLDAGDGSYWPVGRVAWPSPVSGSEFLGQSGATALDVALDGADAGSPAFARGDSGRVLLGIVRPVGPSVAMLADPPHCRDRRPRGGGQRSLLGPYSVRASSGRPGGRRPGSGCPGRRAPRSAARTCRQPPRRCGA